MTLAHTSTVLDSLAWLNRASAEFLDTLMKFRAEVVREDGVRMEATRALAHELMDEVFDAAAATAAGLNEMEMH